MSTSDRHDNWTSGAAYESFMGRLSRPVAHEFLTWLNLPAQSSWLDIGCGTGSLSQTILESASPSEVCGIDQSAAFVEYSRTQIDDPRARFEVGDAQSLSFPDDSFDAVVSGLVLNFVPEPPKAVADMARVAKLNSTVAVYVWDYAEGMQTLRRFWDAATALDAGALELDEGKQRFTICNPDSLTRLFQDAGLRDIEVRPIDALAHFGSFDEYWMPFLGGIGPAGGYVVTLDGEAQNTLRNHIIQSITVAADGSFELTNRAWAVRGRV